MKKLSILIVEDGQIQREMLRDFLRKEGHAAAEADSGEKALAEVRGLISIFFSWTTRCRA